MVRVLELNDSSIPQNGEQALLYGLYSIELLSSR